MSNSGLHPRDQRNTDAPREDEGDHNTRRSGNRRSNKSNKPSGELEALSPYVYDIGQPHKNQEMFVNTTKKIAKYVLREYSHAGKFCLGMINQTLPTLTPPTPPDANASLAEIEMYKFELKTHHNNVVNQRDNEQKIFSMVLGQCSQALQNLLEASAT